MDVRRFIAAWSLLAMALVCANAVGRAAPALAAEEPPAEEVPAAEEPPAGEEPPSEEAPAEEAPAEEEGGGPYVPGNCASQLNVPAELGQPQQEIRRLRNDVRDTCEALVHALRAEVVNALGPMFSELQQLQVELGSEGVIAERLGHIAEAAQTTAERQCEGPCEVRLDSSQLPLSVESSGGGGAGSAELGSLEKAVDAAGEACREALWWIAGVIVFSLVAFAFVRLFGFLDWGHG